jgi:3-hydroxybutyrate dehydrogenase
LKKLSIEDAAADLLGEKQPSKKFTTPEQIGDMVIFLSSPSASNITGTYPNRTLF